jgi:AraC family transcriptional regulator
LFKTHHVDLAGNLHGDLSSRPDLWPAGPQRSSGHTTSHGLSAVTSRSEYAQRTRFHVIDSEDRLQMSVWLRDGVDVRAEDRSFHIAGNHAVMAYQPGVPWVTDMAGQPYHVGLLLKPELLLDLAGEEQGSAFLRHLRHQDNLTVRPVDLNVLRAARELDAVLLAPAASPLLREAKSLELLARLIEGCAAGAPPAHQHDTLGAAERARLDHARDLLLADIARAPTIAQLARACGLSALRLKQGFKQRHGLPVYTYYQQARMREAFDLIASGALKVSETGLRLGYSNLSHFATAFRKVCGMLPSEVRRRQCEPVARNVT